MSLAELRVFNAVAQTGSFRGAAEHLGRTQPTVTAQVKSLEAAYRVELFVRGRGTKTVITPIGERLFETTRQIFQLESDADALLQGSAALSTGVLRLGAVAPRRALRMIERFNSLYPDIDIHLELGNSAELQTKVVQCTLDLALLGAHDHHPACSALVLSRPEIVLIAHRDHPIHAAGTVSRDAFARLLFIQREMGSESRALMDAQMRLHGYHARRIIEIASREGVCAAVSAGIGIGFISAEELPDAAEIRTTRFKEFQVFGEMRLVYLRSRAQVGLIQAFLRLLDEKDTALY